MKNNSALTLAAFFSFAGGTQESIAQVKSEVAPANSLSLQAKLVHDFALASGRTTFMMVIKNDPQIIVFEEGKEVFRTRAFLARKRGDEPSLDQATTPAGTFYPEIWDIKKTNHPLTRGGSIIPYYCDDGPCDKNKNGTQPYSIHPTLETASEKRATLNAAVSWQLSNGCIRVPLENYNKLVSFMRKHGDEALPLLILPNDEAKTRVYFDIPDSFQPKP